VSVKKKRKDCGDTRVALLIVGNSISDCHKHWRERERRGRGRETEKLAVCCGLVGNSRDDCHSRNWFEIDFRQVFVVDFMLTSFQTEKRVYWGGIP